MIAACCAALCCAQVGGYGSLARVADVVFCGNVAKVSSGAAQQQHRCGPQPPCVLRTPGAAPQPPCVLRTPGAAPQPPLHPLQTAQGAVVAMGAAAELRDRVAAFGNGSSGLQVGLAAVAHAWRTGRQLAGAAVVTACSDQGYAVGVRVSGAARSVWVVGPRLQPLSARPVPRRCATPAAACWWRLAARWTAGPVCCAAARSSSCRAGCDAADGLAIRAAKRRSEHALSLLFLLAHVAKP
jgi:hypothetical protein